MKIPSNCRWQPTGRTIGQGRQGSVVAVTDNSGQLDGEYALKRIGSGKPKTAYTRFAREIAAKRSADHPGIVKVVDHAAPDDDFQFYVMELVEGARSLKELLGTADNPFHGDASASLRFFVGIVSALSECERLEIVHRDLSPANVLIADSDVKIIDFGLCQIADDRTITLVDEGVGTPNYMAPECESGAVGEVSVSADLYSAGKLLWAAIANVQAFSREAQVFGQKSMQELFPDNPSTWHLHHVFEKTIRHKATDRFSNTESALVCARRVESLIRGGYPPLETIMETCPLCGWGTLASFQQSHCVFGNPNPSGIRAVQCDQCGYCFAHSYQRLKENLDRRRQLS